MIPTLSFNIETSTSCNASCHFCPYITTAKVRSGKSMDRDLFHKIIDEIATIPVASGINLMGLNEPLLDRRLEEFVFYVRTQAHHVSTCIYTNGLLLNETRYQQLKNAGLDSIVFSLNAVTPEQHEKIMGMRGKFDIVCQNIDYALQFGYPRVSVHAVFTGDTFTEPDRDAFYSRWGDERAGGHGLVIREANWAGQVDISSLGTTGITFANECCSRALSQIYITYDGIVTTCCLDPFGRQVFGDLKTQTIREVYNADTYLQFRTDHASDRADRYEICKGCTRV